ncbi:hypothetical protein ACXYMU_07760 [Pontibacter sp. CAU 1760]
MNDKRQGHQSKAKHWLKVGAWVVGIALLLFVGLIFFTDWLQQRIEHNVQKQSKGVYSLRLHGLQVSPFAGALSVDSLQLKPDYQRWQQIAQQDQEAPRTLLDLRTKAIEITGLNYFKMLFGKGVTIGKLGVQLPKLLVTQMREDTTRQQHKPLHETGSGLLKNLKISTINLDSAGFVYRNSPKAAKALFIVPRFNLTVDDFQLDSQSFHAENRAYYSNEMRLATTGMTYRFPDNTYTLRTDSVTLSTQTEKVDINNLELTPVVSPRAMAQKKGKAVSYMNVHVPHIQLTGLDFAAHSRSNNVITRHILLSNPVLEAYKDKQNFENAGNQPLPHTLMQQMQANILLDSVVIRNGTVKYSELVPKATKRGHISLRKLNVTARNVSNMPAHMSGKKPAVVNANGLIMGKVPIKLRIYLPLLNKSGYHRIKGSMASGDFSILNPMIGPTGFVRFESGHMRRADFDVELTSRQAKGSYVMLYDNLKIDVLSTDGSQSFGKKVLTKVANIVVIKESNPGDKGEKPRRVTVQVTRDPAKSVFSYWTDCLKDGFMTTVGVPEKMQKM